MKLKKLNEGLLNALNVTVGSNSIPLTCSPWFLEFLFGRKIFPRSWDIWFLVYPLIHFEICDVTISTRDHTFIISTRRGWRRGREVLQFAIYLWIQLLLSNESYCSFLWMGGSQNWTFFVYVINVWQLSIRLEYISEISFDTLINWLCQRYCHTQYSSKMYWLTWKQLQLNNYNKVNFVSFWSLFLFLFLLWPFNAINVKC